MQKSVMDIDKYLSISVQYFFIPYIIMRFFFNHIIIIIIIIILIIIIEVVSIVKTYFHIMPKTLPKVQVCKNTNINIIIMCRFQQHELLKLWHMNLSF